MQRALMPTPMRPTSASASATCTSISAGAGRAPTRKPPHTAVPRGGGDGAARKAAPAGVARRQLARALGTPHPEVPDQEDAVLRRRERHAAERLLGGPAVAAAPPPRGR